MRIIAGKEKGRNLSSLKNSNARPTLGRVKEAIFSMIAQYIHNSEVLDLFAGFGGLGLEAISRGAKKATFVEKNYKNAKVIRENINLCKFQDQANLEIEDVFTFVTNNSQKFDIIFMDPPYNQNYEEKTLQIIYENNLIKKEGLIIIEHTRRNKVSSYETLIKVKEKEYGDSAVTIIQQREDS